MFIKHSEGKIDSVYNNKKEAKEDIKKKASKVDIKKEVDEKDKN